ncbi:ferredoxin-NADP reductase [endosymbiont of Sipalinus gigas]|uniref:FAD-binding oxidoreductase n=1 Tax=endosymbiont of Sipalinus gigas TaxID=1972134 RepID=UPI000DC7165E|nr:FAD-binding oxidoreductase [endosymbiont of Sipalinus gigas]BBA85324.1 ferredoxin-NADP reductase [endosymbiont of Sipalinus gigas]
MWIKAKLIKLKKINDYLFSFIFKSEINNFIAGQFSKIKFKINNIEIQRSYSYVNPPKSKFLEFYISRINNGKVSNFLYNSKPGFEFLITKKSFGNFNIMNIPNCNTLWMLSHGTAIGPYLSILRGYNKNFFIEKFKKIILIYSIKTSEDFFYKNIINNIKDKLNNIIEILVLTSSEIKKEYINGKISNLIYNGFLESYLNKKINTNDHIMICGNENMIKEIKYIILKKYKKLNNYNNIFSYEKYW